ncbi:LysR family transcriptional regulator [Thalassococcus sp. S3]|uniref:LysR family transcriptional regulator n=1 Tax=Thalassococcus sp. S3 TaxID=2017482 RepID=UPI001C2CB4BF|nr:LysR family transcriptional regulator [Thalassococcus sp. S3]
MEYAFEQKDPPRFSAQIRPPRSLRRSRQYLDGKLAGIDLNLLTALEALLISQNVTHAAKRLGQSQPAMSRALARLRDLLGDDLLVRSSTGMRLTSHGEHLAQKVPAAMSQIRQLVAARDTSAVEVKLSVSSHLAPAILPEIHKATRGSPFVLSMLTHGSVSEGLDRISNRTADFLLGQFDDLGPDLESRALFWEDFVTLLSPKSAYLNGGRIAAADFTKLTHVNLVTNGRESFPQIGQALSQIGMSRNNLVEIPDVASAAFMAAEGGLALTVPRTVASWVTKLLHLTAVTPPVVIARQPISLVWRCQRSTCDTPALVGSISNAVLASLDNSAQDVALTG